MERGPLRAVEVIATAREHLVERHELHEVALWTVRRLVEHEPTVSDASMVSVHRGGSIQRLVERGCAPPTVA